MDTQKRLAVLSVAYPLAPVGVDAVGGAEQVLTAIDEALVAAGHQSIVIACEGSSPKGTLVPIGLPAEFDIRATAHVQACVREAIAREVDRHAVDLVHMHGMDLNAYAPRAEVPLLATLHLPVAWYPRAFFSPPRPHTYVNCVSAAQRRDCPEGERLLDEITNGVSLDKFAPAKAPAKEDFVLAMGQISPDKGFHVALDAAKRAKVPMRLAGNVLPFEAHRRHFQNDIQPRLDASRVLVGPLGTHEKARTLAAARCVLIPSVVSETSLRVAMEALASGTPVIAFRVGAIAQVVDDGKTGFLVSSVAEMADAIGRVDALRAEDCVRTAKERFSAAKMCEAYLALYGRLAERV